MEELELRREVFGKIILAKILLFDVGIHVSVAGGSASHIGAISIISPDESCSTIQFQGHKDRLISDRWALELAQRCLCPVVVEAGIHYDGLNSDQIAEVVASTDDMLSELLKHFDKHINKQIVRKNNGLQRE